MSDKQRMKSAIKDLKNGRKLFFSDYKCIMGVDCRGVYQWDNDSGDIVPRSLVQQLLDLGHVKDDSVIE